MTRSVYCSTCKKEKEPGREEESRCKVCKAEARKRNRERKRAEAGKLPWGAKKNLCSCCGVIKENVDATYCHACTRIKDKEKRLRLGIVTIFCDCGKKKESTRKIRCNECDNEVRREKNRQDSRKYRMSTNAYKDAVRHLTFKAIEKGILIRKPCEVCGSTEKIEAHHDDYHKPLEVRWLCKKHHMEHHKNRINEDK